MQQEETKNNGEASTNIDTSQLYTNPGELERVLFSMTQPDNAELKKATIILTDFLEKPESVVPLLQQIEQSQKEEVRQMASVYLREQIETHWEKIPKDTQIKIKAFLLSKLDAKYRAERLAIAACVSSIAKFELIHSEWDALLQLLSKMCDKSKTSNSELRETGVTIWRNIIQFCGGSLKKHFQIILTILESALHDEESLKTQVEAVKAIGLMVEFLENENEISVIENVIPNMCLVIERCLKAGDEDNVLSGMEVFNDLAESKIPILNKHSKQLVQFNIGIASAKDKLPMTVRKQAVNFIQWMTKSKPKTVIKQEFLKEFLQLGINLILEQASMSEEEQRALNENENDAKKATDDLEDGFVSFCSPLAMGCDLLDTIFKSLASEVVFPMGIKAIEALMNENKDETRQTAYTVIAMMIEGTEIMIAKGNNLNILLETCLKGSQDSNKMVRKCALEAITQLATHMHYKVLPYHSKVLPIIFNVFERENEDVRVIERGLNAIEMFIDAFTESSEDETYNFKIEFYAPQVMKIVEKCIKSNATELKTQSLTTIASVASAAGIKFEPYLDGTLKLLETALKSTDSNNNLTDSELLEMVAIRSEATSCLGSVAVAVGYNVYSQYFDKFHTLVMNGLQEIDDSNLRESTFIYFSEISKLIGDNICDIPSFEDMLISVLWIMQDDDGVQVKMPDDGFGGTGKGKNNNLKLFNDENDELDDTERLLTLATENTKLEDLQNMSEEELTALLRKQLNEKDERDNKQKKDNDDNEEEADNEDNDTDDEEAQEYAKQIQNSVGQLQTVKISVRTGFMEEKAAAIHCLTQFIKYGGSGMLENLDTCFDQLLRLWDYPHALVKMALINCFHAFFNSIVKFALKDEINENEDDNNNGNKNNDNKIGEYSNEDGVTLKYKWTVGDSNSFNIYNETVASYIEEMFPLYIQAIIDEEDNDTLNLLIDNFIEELRVLGPSSINDYMNDLVNAIKLFLNGKTALLKTGDDPNDQEMNKIATKHEYVIDAIAELISTLAELWGDKFLNVWNELFPYLMKHGGENKHPHDRAMTVGCIADVCSNLANIVNNDVNNKSNIKEMISKYSNDCFKLALTCAQSVDVNMRQNALYCIGSLFSVCNQESNLQHSNDVLRCIQVYIKFNKNGTRGEQLVRDNAVSALGKVILAESEALPMVKELMNAFIESLPLTADFSENKYVYDVLMRLVIEESELCKPHIVKILSLLAAALPSEEISPKTTNMIITFFKKICNDKTIQEIIKTKLSNENQENIIKALNIK